jgi:flagellar biosynthetic protein FliR
MVLYPIAKEASGLFDPDSLTQIIMLAVKEAAVGLTLGFVAKTIFDSIAFAFTFAAMQMGFMFSSFYDPMLETQSPTISQLMMILASLLFLVFDGHHLMIKALADSFITVPLGQGQITKELSSYVIETGSQMFVIGLKLSAPIVAVLFVVNMAFGVVAKAVPQINVIMVSFTVNILVGIIVLGLCMPFFGTSIAGVTQEMITRFYGALGHFNG